jgi:hypothetical protein
MFVPKKSRLPPSILQVYDILVTTDPGISGRLVTIPSFQLQELIFSEFLRSKIMDCSFGRTAGFGSMLLSHST